MDEENLSEPQMPNLAKKVASVPVQTEAIKVKTNKKSPKRIIFIILVVIILAGLGFLLFETKSSIKRLVFRPSPFPVPTQTPAPTEAPKLLQRSEWSLEILNGSGSTGLVKKMAIKVKELGYPVVKTGNADKNNYAITQMLVRKGLEDKMDLVIADLKDTIKIASFAGELKDSTASARIILGKDSI